MTEKYFVKEGSIVREIWGKADTILLIFAGAAAEFALNKSVDWLYFTGKLPRDPIGRLFSTVSYARSIVFSPYQVALQSIDTINTIHANVENKRGAQIPGEAYRDVLYMLIDYSIRSFEILERKMDQAEKQEVLDVFLHVGNRMHISDLPGTLEEWTKVRRQHLNENLCRSHFTDDLFQSYRIHLGEFRYRMLQELQIIVVPDTVRELLQFRTLSMLKPLIPL